MKLLFSWSHPSSIVISLKGDNLGEDSVSKVKVKVKVMTCLVSLMRIWGS